MTWLSLLVLVAVVIAAVAVVGVRPRGTRPVARTGLMTVARVVLGLVALLLAYVAWRG